MISASTAGPGTWGNGRDGWRLVRDADLSVIQERVPAAARFARGASRGTAEMRHCRDRSRQPFFVPSGELTLEVGRAGGYLRTGAPHRAMNAAEGDDEFIVVSRPPGCGGKPKGRGVTYFFMCPARSMGVFHPDPIRSPT